ncbi:MAG: hypothetical protein KBF89_03965 [Acidimicrobiia bacterium]|nr:hypothetical protein [Acidimicrobiia bacterium]
MQDEKRHIITYGDDEVKLLNCIKEKMGSFSNKELIELSRLIQTIGKPNDNLLRNIIAIAGLQVLLERSVGFEEGIEVYLNNLLRNRFEFDENLETVFKDPLGELGLVVANSITGAGIETDFQTNIFGIEVDCFIDMRDLTVSPRLDDTPLGGTLFDGNLVDTQIVLDGLFH